MKPFLFALSTLFFVTSAFSNEFCSEILSDQLSSNPWFSKDDPDVKYTTLAVGEEGGDFFRTTKKVGEEGGEEPRKTTFALNEEGGTPGKFKKKKKKKGEPKEATSLALNEEGGDKIATTLAVGEEGGAPAKFKKKKKKKDEPKEATSLALNEEGGDGFNGTSIYLSEEGGNKIATTLAVGEDGNDLRQDKDDDKKPKKTTLALGEEGGDDRSPFIERRPSQTPDATTAALGEEGGRQRRDREKPLIELKPSLLSPGFLAIISVNPSEEKDDAFMDIDLLITNAEEKSSSLSFNIVDYVRTSPKSLKLQVKDGSKKFDLIIEATTFSKVKRKGSTEISFEYNAEKRRLILKEGADALLDDEKIYSFLELYINELGRSAYIPVKISLD